ncbi:MAG: hypothetical protein Q9226_002915 [Calogaya cf. arnoldii]
MTAISRNNIIMVMTTTILFALASTGAMAATQDYVIYPVTTMDLRSGEALHSAIVKQTADSSQNPLVEAIELDKIGGEVFGSSQPQDLSPRALQNYLTQFAPTATELRVLSQPSGEANLDNYKNYVFASGAGIGTFVYHIEMGINGNHVDFQGRQGEWVFTGLARRARQATMDETASSRGHSTCTASKATANLYGASKYASLVAVKMPDLSDKAMLEGLETAYHHIVLHGRGERSVITISWGSKKVYSRYTPKDIWAARMENLLYELAVVGVVIVCAAGNHAQERRGLLARRKTIDTLPAVFGRWTGFPHPAPIHAVGNCNPAGKRYFESQTLDLRPQLHAPGVNCRCAGIHFPEDSQIFTGTSCSAPLVAGVIAGFLPLPNDLGAKERLDYIVDQLGWTRPDGGERVIWDRVDKANNPPFPSLSILGNTSSSQPSNTLLNSSAADWPDTSLPQLPWGLVQTAVA